MPLRQRRLAGAFALALAVVGLAGCASSTGTTANTPPSPTASTTATAPTGSPSASDTRPPEIGDPLTVEAAFYPLAFVAQRVGGPYVTVDNLTSPGAEPHDLELSPQQVASLSTADLVLYIRGFQPAVDKAVDTEATDRAFDAANGLNLLTSPDGGGTDPHLWLDPTNLATIATEVAQRFTASRPQDAATFRANADALVADLRALDAQWQAGTATCANRDLVVSHEAFAYLAQRYRFTQKGISGLSPDAEPSARQLADVADFVRANNVTTIYYETLVDPKIAQTIADETGASTAVLDPLEGLVEGSTADYLSVMRANLAAVRAGQSCT